MGRKHIVIVGGGFAGIKLALKLSPHKNFKVTLISKNNFFEYHSALYRSATGWSPKEVVLPLVDIFSSNNNSNVTVVNDEIISIDTKNKRLKGKNGDTYSYSELVIAVGQIANYYGIKGMQENSYSLNTIRDSFTLREHLRRTVADFHDDNKQRKFIIIGGGATGVELASELHFYLDSLCNCRTISTEKIHITLVEGASRLLPLLSPKASKYAEWRIEKLGVKLLLNTRVQGLIDDELIMQKGKIKSDTVIWTAGAINNKIFADHPKIFRLARNSRVEVNEYLEADKHVFVLGDNANTKYSGMAQTALSDAVFVAKNFIRESRGKEPTLYSPPQPIYAVPVGLNYAVLQWGRVVLRGRPAWILRRIADLKLFLSFEPYKKAIKSWRSGNIHEKELLAIHKKHHKKLFKNAQKNN